MSYIKPEQFLALDKKVQQVFLDWWEPEIGDLIVEPFDGKICPVIKYKMNKFITLGTKDSILTLYELEMHKVIPLLQMHQLVQFIEKPLTAKVEPILSENGYTITACDKDKIKRQIFWLETEIYDLTQALFQAAVELAEKEVENNG